MKILYRDSYILIQKRRIYENTHNIFECNYKNHYIKINRVNDSYLKNSNFNFEIVAIHDSGLYSYDGYCNANTIKEAIIECLEGSLII